MGLQQMAHVRIATVLNFLHLPREHVCEFMLDLLPAL